MKPVLFIIFNRPLLTQRVFDAIKKAKPAQLFISADGPRKGNEEDIKRCSEARKIIEQVDWNCKVFTKFSDTNIGCAKNVSSAIDWFFENAEEGIILEDDCVPNESFFRFCSELLDYYKENEKVMHISGNNFMFGKKVTTDSYFFSIYPHSWGWATWRRAWKHFDFNISNYPKFIEKNILDKLVLNDEKKYWISIFERTFKNPLHFNTWDYQWLFSVWNAGGVSILPNVNLVSNTGFGKNSTHNDYVSDNKLSDIPTREISFPLVHPTTISPNSAADRFMFLISSDTKTIAQRIELLKNNSKQFIRQFIPKSFYQKMSRLKTSNKPQRSKEEHLDWGEHIPLLETWGKENVWKEIEKFMSDKSGKVLDIGCGTGAVMELLSNQFPELDLYGYDCSENLIKKCIQRGISIEKLKTGNAHDLSVYPDNFFDYAYSIGLLHYLNETDVKLFAKECSRITKKESFHHLPVSASNKNEGWIKTWHSFQNNSAEWWLDKFSGTFPNVTNKSSAWHDDTISNGEWLICSKNKDFKSSY